jgi:hypothetical protein
MENYLASVTFELRLKHRVNKGSIVKDRILAIFVCVWISNKIGISSVLNSNVLVFTYVINVLCDMY